MSPRFPFFGILSVTSPIEGLIEHYEFIAKGTIFLEQALTICINEGSELDFNKRQEELCRAKEQADAIKRNMRNHLPRGLFLAIDKPQFLAYLSKQDKILVNGQNSLDWLAMRKVDIPEHFRQEMIDLIFEIIRIINLLGPALRATVDFINGDEVDRVRTKSFYRDIRQQHAHNIERSHILTAKIYNTEMNFKDIYQLIHFVERLQCMSHNTEGCIDLLRSMIAK